MERTARLRRSWYKLAMAASAVLTLGMYRGILPASAEPGVTDSEITIASCCALSGPARLLGVNQLTGAKAYINHINDEGGVNGRKIKLLTYDDGYEPEKAIQCFNKLIKDQAFCGAFFVGTPTAAKYVPMAESAKIPIVGLFTGAQLLHEPFRPHILSVRASYYDETREQIDHLWNDLGMHKIGVIYQADAFGAAVLEGVKRALKDYDSAPVVTGSFARNTSDVDAAIAQVKTANPDAVVLVGSYGSEAAIVKRAHADNWHPLFTTVSFVGTEAFITSAGKDADGVVITQVVPPYNRDDLPTVVLYKKLLKKYFPGDKPNFSSLEGFVDAMVLVDGLKAAGKNLTRDRFIAAVEGIQNRDMGLGPNLRLTYGPHDHKGFDSVYFTVVKNGEPTAVSDWKEIKH